MMKNAIDYDSSLERIEYLFFLSMTCVSMSDIDELSIPARAPVMDSLSIPGFNFINFFIKALEVIGFLDKYLYTSCVVILSGLIGCFSSSSSLRIFFFEGPSTGGDSMVLLVLLLPFGGLDAMHRIIIIIIITVYKMIILLVKN